MGFEGFFAIEACHNSQVVYSQFQFQPVGVAACAGGRGCSDSDSIGKLLDELLAQWDLSLFDRRE